MSLCERPPLTTTACDRCGTRTGRVPPKQVTPARHRALIDGREVRVCLSCKDILAHKALIAANKTFGRHGDPGPHSAKLARLFEWARVGDKTPDKIEAEREFRLHMARVGSLTVDGIDYEYQPRIRDVWRHDTKLVRKCSAAGGKKFPGPEMPRSYRVAVAFRADDLGELCAVGPAETGVAG